jgi:hypothetical protein
MKKSEPTPQRRVEIPAGPNFLSLEMKNKWRGILWERRNPRGESGGDKWTRGKAGNKSEAAKPIPISTHHALHWTTHSSLLPQAQPKLRNPCNSARTPTIIPFARVEKYFIRGKRKREVRLLHISPHAVALRRPFPSSPFHGPRKSKQFLTSS